MNNSLDKLIGNDELLTYICLILAILNTLLMSMVINDTNSNFNIYIFLLFEALFLIFIVYFILKKKDVYSKDDDIKYDWYFYLRVSIIILVFFNFALYIYNITNDPSINPQKNGGGGVFSSSNKVAPTNIDIENKLKIKMLLDNLKPLVEEYTNGLNMVQKNQIDVDRIVPLRLKIEKINAELEKLQRQGESAVATKSSAASRTAASRTAASRESRAASRESRAASRTASNRVVPSFPYQIAY
jgi:hypothetical protein